MTGRPLPLPSLPVLESEIDEWVALRTPFSLVLVQVPNWTDLAMHVGLARIDQLLETVRLAFHDAFPTGARSQNISRGFFAFLVAGDSETTADIARIARRAVVATYRTAEVNVGIATGRGDGEDHAAQLTFHAAWSVMQHAPYRSDRVAVCFPTAMATGT